MKIVINSDFGGFGLSDEAIREYALRKGFTLVEEKCGEFGFTYFYKGEISDNTHFWEGDIERNDADLVEIVERLGSAADGKFSSLKVVEIPEGVDWQVMEYDGREWIADRHRTWSEAKERLERLVTSRSLQERFRAQVRLLSLFRQSHQVHLQGELFRLVMVK